jgi:hypothetical protein
MLTNESVSNEFEMEYYIIGFRPSYFMGSGSFGGLCGVGTICLARWSRIFIEGIFVHV